MRDEMEESEYCIEAQQVKIGHRQRWSSKIENREFQSDGGEISDERGTCHASNAKAKNKLIENLMVRGTIPVDHGPKSTFSWPNIKAQIGCQIADIGFFDLFPTLT